MPIFTSAREKRLWLYTALVLLSIISTLVFGHPLVELFGNQNLQAVIFVFVMLLVGTTILVHGLRLRAGNIEITIWLGLAAVYIMLFLRLGLAERSHLMEYSVLAVFIHLALMERFNQSFKAAIIAFVATVLIGLLDESVQFFLPDRVFDTNDILFNSFAAFMAIAVSLVLLWVRKKLAQPK